MTPDENGQLERRNGGSRPVPDPTVLTSEALAREVKALNELLELRIDGIEKSFTEVHISTGQAIDLHELLVAKRFDGVAREMQLVENQRVEQKQDALASLAAALSAAKEAVKEQTTASGLSIAKSENATNEQLKQLNATFTTALQGVEKQMGDLKDRISRNENVLAAMAGVGNGKQQSWGVIVAAVVGAGSIFGIIMIIIELTATH